MGPGQVQGFGVVSAQVVDRSRGEEGVRAQREREGRAGRDARGPREDPEHARRVIRRGTEEGAMAEVALSDYIAYVFQEISKARDMADRYSKEVALAYAK